LPRRYAIRTLAELLEKVELAGIFVTRRNVVGRSVGEVRAEIGRLQQIQTGRGRPPLLVAADQEGGIIARLSPPLDPVPSLAVVADTVGWRAAVTDYAQQKARNLRALGITLNFAPVVDLKDESVTVTIDLHSLISKRAIAAAPERVAEVADLYVETLARHGVLATAKHFPGIGRVSADTHHFVGHLDRPRAELIASEWVPFKQLRQRQVAVMVSHVIVDQTDPVNPASSSRAMVHDVLRGELGHTGLVITDDLCMSPVVYAEGGVAGVAARSLRAGTDLLLIAWDPELVYPMLAGLLEREPDAGSTGHLKASDRRIARARELLRVIPEDR